MENHETVNERLALHVWLQGRGRPTIVPCGSEQLLRLLEAGRWSSRAPVRPLWGTVKLASFRREEECLLHSLPGPLGASSHLVPSADLQSRQSHFSGGETRPPVRDLPPLSQPGTRGGAGAQPTAVPWPLKVLAAGPKPVPQVQPSSAGNAASVLLGEPRRVRAQDEWTFDLADVELLLNMSPQKVLYAQRDFSPYYWKLGDRGHASHWNALPTRNGYLRDSFVEFAVSPEMYLA